MIRAGIGAPANTAMIPAIANHAATAAIDRAVKSVRNANNIV
jgi:hypothetical protein